MMIFSAVWVMVIYLNIPTTQQPIQDITVTTNTGSTITIPSVEADTWVVATWSNTNTWEDIIITWSDSIVTWTDTIVTGENAVMTWA
jgi:hypothetical protein